MFNKLSWFGCLYGFWRKNRLDLYLYRWSLHGVMNLRLTHTQACLNYDPEVSSNNCHTIL